MSFQSFSSLSIGTGVAVVGLGAASLFFSYKLCKHKKISPHPESRGFVLVTGGAGFIGSHCVISLVEQGFQCVIVDNLSNSSEKCIERIRRITGKPDWILFHKVDLMDKSLLEDVFKRYIEFVACIHFAGLKAVGESTKYPLLYHRTNLTSTFNLIDLMKQYHCTKIIFSSSATVYGNQTAPFTEETPVGQGITNAYGRTKYFIEKILEDVWKSNKVNGETFSATTLRYFNPVGAHPSGLIGEDPRGIPNNLVPFIAQVMVGRRSHLSVFGIDFPTRDGSGIRDYIHVMDLATGHTAALDDILKKEGEYSVYNLGTGNGISVLEMVKAFEKVSGLKIPYEIEARREGDIAESYGIVNKAKEKLGWEAKHSIEDMCAHTWNWQSNNPNGF